jgi:D-alanyl-D-alanine carboxypeptidase
MAWLNSGARHGLRYSFLGSAAIAAALLITSDTADARHYHRGHAHYAHAGHGHRHAHAEEYSPPSSSILVDGNSGAVLQASNPDAPRHPASLTKVMTLYLLFERLDAGKIRLDTELKVSQHASEQDPTKLDLKPGQTIAVEDAIKGIVTKSANDAAVVVAENLGGDEAGFARLMTQKAHALGMSHTTYVNASGLPDNDQITTAHDQALLGRAIQDRFPRYYKYFSTPSFVYHGEAMRNHNHLLGSVDGVDGIKTGFTSASGFNLLTSVHRDGRYLVGVVMGGVSASSRDAHMRELISDHIKEAALHRTAPMLAEDPAPHEEAQPIAFAKTPMVSQSMVAQPIVTQPMAPKPVAAQPTVAQTIAARTEPATPAANVDAHAASAANDPIRPLLVRTITYRTAPVQTASLGPMPSLLPVAPPAAPQPVAALPSVSPQVTAAPLEAPRAVVAAARPVEVASAEPAKSDLAAAAPIPVQPSRADPLRADLATPQPVKIEPAVAIPATAIHARGGWLIQIGAFDDEDQAKQHLSAAQLKMHTELASADPFTERVQKGDKALYRARFAGFDKATAEDTCKQLKRSDFQCMALKD